MKFECYVVRVFLSSWESCGRVEAALSRITNGKVVELVIYDLMAGNNVLQDRYR